jgi:hypothetical protein
MSVNFLQSTQLVVNQVRLPNHMYYSGKVFTYRLDQTTVTVGVPRMLAMSTSPASAGASSWASVAVGSSAIATSGSVLPSTTGGWRVSCATSSSTVGAGLRLALAGSPTVSQSPSSTWSTGSEGGISYKQQNFVFSIHNIEKRVLDYITQRAYLLGCGLRDLKLLGHTLAGHIVRLPWRRRKTSLQASWRILDERDVGQSRAAES